MHYTVSNPPNGVRFTLFGQFTFADSAVFRQIIDLSGKEGVHLVELDFSGIDFIDSAGLGMLLLLRNTCQNKHASISITGAHGQVEKIFTISKFDQLFSMAS